MRIGIVSDIHCNAAALDRAVEQMGDIDELLCAGDACYQYRFSNDVAERLKSLGGRYVLGNHEEILLSEAGARAQASASVDRSLLEWTRDQPHLIRTEIGSKKLLMFHATPWAPTATTSSPTTRNFSAWPKKKPISSSTAIPTHRSSSGSAEPWSSIPVPPGKCAAPSRS